MRDTKVSLTAADLAQFAARYWPHEPRVERQRWIFGEVCAFAALASTVPDFARFGVTMSWFCKEHPHLGRILSHDDKIDGHSMVLGLAPSIKTAIIVLADGTQANALRDQPLPAALGPDLLPTVAWLSRIDAGVLTVGGPQRLPDGRRIGTLWEGVFTRPRQPPRARGDPHDPLSHPHVSGDWSVPRVLGVETGESPNYGHGARRPRDWRRALGDPGPPPAAQ
jgi:hypothetical protein